jgi:hypothetical protein
MALPPQRLLNDDLFVINRIEATDVDTYKINANDIGIFLLEAPRPPGSSPDDKFVNDGPLNVYGEIPGSGAGYINLHSANEYCEGKLTFSEDFYITGNAHDVTVSLNYAEVSSELSCNNSGGIDGSGDCLVLEMNWLAENIICSGKGLDNSCGTGIGIDLCDHSGLQFPASGCLQVNLCGDRGIIHHPSDGCMMVDLNFLTNNLSCNGLRPSDGDIDSHCMEIDMEWLANNIRCGDLHDPLGTNSGLIDNGGCIEIDPCWVGDRLNPDNTQYSFGKGDAESIDTNGCLLRVNEDWLLNWAQNNIKDIKNTSSSKCLTITGSNLFKEDVEIDLDDGCLQKQINDSIDARAVTKIIGDSCIKVKNGDGPVVELEFETSCGGGSGTPVTPNDGKLTIKKGDNGIRFTKKSGANFSEVDEIVHSADTKLNDTYKIDVDPESCPSWNVPLSGQKLFLKASGGGAKPTLVLGTNQASPNKNPGDPGVDNQGYACINDDVTGNKCTHGRLAWLGISSNQQNGSFTCHRGIEGWRPDVGQDCGGSPDGDTDRLFSVAAGTKVLPHHASAGIITSGSGLAEDVRIFKYNQNPGGNDNGIVGGRPDQGEYNRFCFRKASFIRGEITELSRATDTRVNLNIDNVLDTFGGYADDPAVSDGIFRWGNKPMGESPDHKYPFLFIDPYELGAKLPGFVDFTPDASSWEVVESRDDDGELIDADFILKDDFDPATQLEVGAVNWQALHALAIAALVKHKNRIAELEAKTTREGTLNTLGIVEYTNETAAANSGLGQGEVYWDTTLNKMRAVT